MLWRMTPTSINSIKRRLQSVRTVCSCHRTSRKVTEPSMSQVLSVAGIYDDRRSANCSDGSSCSSPPYGSRLDPIVGGYDPCPYLRPGRRSIEQTQPSSRPSPARLIVDQYYLRFIFSDVGTADKGKRASSHVFDDEKHTHTGL